MLEEKRKEAQIRHDSIHTDESYEEDEPKNAEGYTTERNNNF